MTQQASPGWSVPAPSKRQCGLCLRHAFDVAVALVKWRDPLPGQTWGHVARCQDHGACRARMEASGEAWPIDDGTPPTRPPAAPHEPSPAGHPAPHAGLAPEAPAAGSAIEDASPAAATLEPFEPLDFG